MRTSQRRQLHARRAAWLLALLILCGVGLYFAWRGGEAFIRWAVIDNQHFAIRQIVIENDGVIRNEQVAEWAGVRRGLNLFALDLNRVRRDLELLPVIASAQVERVLPHTIRIRILEREPIAQCVLPELPSASRQAQPGIYTIDAYGFVMVPLQPYQCRSGLFGTWTHLPRITGIPRQEIRTGHALEHPEARAALQLVEAFARSPVAGLVELQSVDVSQPGILQVQTSQSATITFATTDFERQLYRWRAVIDYGRRLGKQPASLNLSVTNNLPLIWQEAELAPLPSFPEPAPSNPTPNRKKHV